MLLYKSCFHPNSMFLSSTVNKGPAIRDWLALVTAAPYGEGSHRTNWPTHAQALVSLQTQNYQIDVEFKVSMQFLASIVAVSHTNVHPDK